MTIHERIRYVRKTLGLTLSAFGTPIGYDGSTISKMENARAPYVDGVDERVILAIARQYRISKAWLRDGEGPVFEQGTTPEQADKEESRVQWALSLFAQLCPEDQKKILEIARELVRVGEKKNAVEETAADSAGEVRRRKSA